MFETLLSLTAAIPANTTARSTRSEFFFSHSGDLLFATFVTTRPSSFSSFCESGFHPFLVKTALSMNATVGARNSGSKNA